jgi:hypothetical protein
MVSAKDSNSSASSFNLSFLHDMGVIDFFSATSTSRVALLLVYSTESSSKLSSAAIILV